MSELTACQRLDIIRHKGRPTAKDYIPLIFDDFFETDFLAMTVLLWAV